MYTLSLCGNFQKYILVFLPSLFLRFGVDGYCHSEINLASIKIPTSTDIEEERSLFPLGMFYEVHWSTLVMNCCMPMALHLCEIMSCWPQIH